MEKERNGILQIISSTIIMIFIFLIVIYYDKSFLNNKLFSGLTNGIINAIDASFGSFGFVMFILGILSGLSLLLMKSTINRVIFVTGSVSVLFFLTGFFQSFYIENLNGGTIGFYISNLLSNQNMIIQALIYFVWFTLSLLFLLFPFKNVIAHFIIVSFSLFKGNKTEAKYEKVNRNLKESVSKPYAKNYENVPWISKVVYENSKNRVETPIIPAVNPVKKFKLESTDETGVEQYIEVQTDPITTDIIEEEYSDDEKEKKAEEYFKKVRENWPQTWKGNKDFPVVIDEDRREFNDISREFDLQEVSENNYEEIVIPDDKIQKNILIEEKESVDFEKIYTENFPSIVKPDYKNSQFIDPAYKLPGADILYENTIKRSHESFSDEDRECALILENTLLEFDIKAEVSDIIHGPVVTLYKLIPSSGVKLSKIEGLSTNLALRLAAQSIRIIAPIPGEKVVGIEIPNKKRELVSFKEIINSEEFIESDFNIPIGIGKDIYGKIIVLDLYKMPHILIAGATGSGKSVCVNSFIASILFARKPDEIRLILIDPKIVELKPYNNIPHLLTPVITESKAAMNALKYLLFEMERRYSLLDQMGVRDIVDYRKMQKTKKTHFEDLPFIVAFVDEFADLMTTSGKEAEILFARLAAKARAVGILLVLATQRPSADVITGLIKANIPARIAFQVIALQDSRIILDQKGAEKLLGQGDMLYLSPSQPFPIRLQGAYLSKDEVDSIADHWKGISEPNYIDINEFIDVEDEGDENFEFEGESKDPLFEQAIDIVYQTRKASASYLQRRLNIGYNRAARMVEEMESKGIVGPQRGAKAREIIGLREDEL